MRTIFKSVLVLAAIAAAIPACGSDPADALAGEWAGQCTTPDGAGGLDATLKLDKDGKFTQSITGNEASGTYTVTDKTIKLSATGGEALDAPYTLNGDSLTVTTPGSSPDSPGASTCKLQRH